MSFVTLFASLRSLHASVYRVPFKKCPGAYFKFQLKRWAFIGRRALNRGERLLRFPWRDVPGIITAFTKSEAMGKTF